MILTFKAKLVWGAYATEPCVKYIEADSKTTLYDLHLCILQEIDFDYDHLFEFYIGRNHRNHSFTFVDEDDFDFEPDEVFSKLWIEKIFTGMPKGMKLIYHFDFGDDWMFEITKTRAKARPENNADSGYPRVIKSEGVNPVQYPNCEE